MNKYRIINHATNAKTIVEANSAHEAAQKVGCRIKEVSLIDIGQPKLSGMPLSKAIEILLPASKEATFLHPQPFVDALKLGIEAMKRLEALRGNWTLSSGALLPGEIEDYCNLCGIAHTDIDCPSREGEL